MKMSCDSGYCGMCRQCRRDLKEVYGKDVDYEVDRPLAKAVQEVEEKRATGKGSKKSTGQPSTKSRSSYAGMGMSPGEIKNARRERNMAGRVVVDGYLINPDSPSHGTASARADWGCNCAVCREYGRLKGIEHRARVRARKEQGK